MHSSLKALIKIPFNLIGLEIETLRYVNSLRGRALPQSAEQHFHSTDYLRANQRRQEHLASLDLEIAGASVFEVAAGIGDHTSFFLDRDCNVVTSEARQENLDILKQKYPGVEVFQINLDHPPDTFHKSFDIVYCYGALYHCENPGRAIEFMAGCCRKMILMSTCVSFGEDSQLNPIPEEISNPTQAVSGIGCRPTRKWVRDELAKYFEHVYFPVTQPNHKDFPLNWASAEQHKSQHSRAVFIASREVLDNELLTESIPMTQRRSG